MVSGHLRRWISAFQQARDLIIMLTKIYSLRALMKTVLEAMSSERFFGYRLEISQRSLSTYCEICEVDPGMICSGSFPAGTWESSNSVVMHHQYDGLTPFGGL